MSELSRRELLALSAAALMPGFARASAAGPASLNALAAAKGLRFGSCLGTGPSGAPHPGSFDGKRANSYDDPQVREIFLRECGILVPENELKWYTLRPAPDVFDFSRADRLIAFADANNLLMRGHTLLWHNMQWFPAWVANYDFGPRPATEAERLLRAHIATVCGKYGDRIFAWDVVNETIDPDTGGMRETVFTRYLGDRVIDIAFDAARTALPHAQLVYNDYMSWGPGNAKHRAGVVALLERLKKNGTPIDALGVQAHIGPGASATTPTLGPGDEREWRGFLDAATGLGLDLVITEFDEGDQNLPADIALRDAAVADLARRYFDVMLSYPQLRYVMAWGLVDKYSWLRERWPRPDGLPKRPSLYDDDYRPKPMRDAIAGAFRAAPQRNWLL
ncbi:MAG: endo-1,4-beta-xylanase [Rhizomicrobium sp.]